MVCKKCEKKLQKLACPETWREGSTNSTVGKSGGKAARGVAENKLSKKSARHNPYGSQCELCKAVLHQQQAKYCHTCAYSKGLCTMCGKQVADTTGYKQSNT